LAFMWLAYTFPAMAGPVDPPGEDDPIDPAPINKWALILIMAAITIGIYVIMKYKRKAII